MLIDTRIAKLPKVDVHCHTTNRPLKHTVSPDASLPAIQAKMLEFHVVRTVLLATYFPHRSSGISNYRMWDWISSFGKGYFDFFGSLDFEHYFYQGLNELEELNENQALSGVKIYHGYQEIEDGKLSKVLDFCSANQLPVIFHTGDCTHMGGKCAGVDELDKFVEEYPEVTFIYAHMCNPHIEKAIEKIKRYPNIYTDISGLIHSGKDDHEIPGLVESLKKFHGECGMDRLLFGTDFPIQTYEHTIQIADAAFNHATDQELEKFCWMNADKILNHKKKITRI